jgi:sialidase-1
VKFLPKKIIVFTFQDTHHRQSLQNSYLKFSLEKRGTVAFMGGSITEHYAWRGKVESYLKSRFPWTTFQFINAGISSTGSTPGAFRLNQDVLSKGPIDLFFEEAAVNDEVNGFNEKAQIRGMEGIVNHALNYYPKMDVVLLHFIDPPKLEIYKNGGIPKVILNHEKVAEHYQVNSIHLAREVSDRIVADEFNWKDDFKDLHPSEFGHEIYSRSITAFLDDAFEKASKEGLKPVKRKMPKSLDGFSYTSGQYLPVSLAENISNWNFIEEWSPKDGVSIRKRFVDIPAMVAEVSGAELKLDFIGRAIGICIASGPDAGMIEYSIDGAAFKKIDLYTQWSAGLHLPWYVMLNDELQDKKHTVTIRTLVEKNEKSKGNACRILHFLVN